MIADPPSPDEQPDDGITARRLRLELEDLRFENARLKLSIAQRQDEIFALSDRLKTMQAHFGRRHRVTAWVHHLQRFSPLRVLLRRR